MHLSKQKIHIKNIFKSTMHRYKQSICRTITQKDKIFKLSMLEIHKLLANTSKIAINLWLTYQQIKVIMDKRNRINNLLITSSSIHLLNSIISNSKMHMISVCLIFRIVSMTQVIISPQEFDLCQFLQVITLNRIIDHNICIFYHLKQDKTMYYLNLLEIIIPIILTNNHKDTKLLVSLEVDHSNNNNNNQWFLEKEMK